MRYIICFLSAFIAVYMESGGFELLACQCPLMKIPFAEGVNHCRQYILSLCALIFLWAFLKTYYKEKARQKFTLSPEDLTLLKIIETNAQIICQKYRPHQNVVNIEDWRKK